MPGRKNLPAFSSAAPGSAGGVGGPGGIRVSVTGAPLVALVPNLGRGGEAHLFTAPVRVGEPRPGTRTGQGLRATPAYTGTMPSAWAATSSGPGRQP
ncbi:hypothetical protein GCM10018780_04320 [Streptomyces lanatus]|nr:hypothetical protein GCM10018780_04320 [Streptomyces lanatus]